MGGRATLRRISRRAAGPRARRPGSPQGGGDRRTTPRTSRLANRAAGSGRPKAGREPPKWLERPRRACGRVGRCSTPRASRGRASTSRRREPLQQPDRDISPDRPQDCDECYGWEPWCFGSHRNPVDPGHSRTMGRGEPVTGRRNATSPMGSRHAASQAPATDLAHASSCSRGPFVSNSISTPRCSELSSMRPNWSRS